MSRATVTLAIRLRPDQVDHLDEVRERDHRSRAAQIAYYVSRGLEAEKNERRGVARAE